MPQRPRRAAHPQVPPLQAVGWEGIFGMCIMSILCIIFFFVPGDRAGNKFENINDAMIQVGTPVLRVFLLRYYGTVFSFTLFFLDEGIYILRLFYFFLWCSP
jgi:hypothetical protein